MSIFYIGKGKISLKPTPSSKPISRRFAGNTYYVSGTTKSNRDAVEKALSNNLWKLGLKFRDGDITYDAYKKIVNTLTMTSIVVPVFYIHIWNPENFPILDEKVWRTYKWSRGEALNKQTKPRSFSHYEEYISFFKNLVDTTDLDWRTIDKGVWVWG